MGEIEHFFRARVTTFHVLVLLNVFFPLIFWHAFPWPRAGAVLVARANKCVPRPRAAKMLFTIAAAIAVGAYGLAAGWYGGWLVVCGQDKWISAIFSGIGATLLVFTFVAALLGTPPAVYWPLFALGHGAMVLYAMMDFLRFVETLYAGALWVYVMAWAPRAALLWVAAGWQLQVTLLVAGAAMDVWLLALLWLFQRRNYPHATAIFAFYAASVAGIAVIFSLGAGSGHAVIGPTVEMCLLAGHAWAGHALLAWLITFFNTSHESTLNSMMAPQIAVYFGLDRWNHNYFRGAK
jgi:hypothetical protein